MTFWVGLFSLSDSSSSEDEYPCNNEKALFSILDGTDTYLISGYFYNSTLTY